MTAGSKPPPKCPHQLDDVDLFTPGAQNCWYDAYDILHQHAPVHRIPGEGGAPGTDGYILCKYADIVSVVKDIERFPPPPFALTPIDEADTNDPDPEYTPEMNAMAVSIASLRPTPELWRAHRQQLTDPWVGPGATRHTDMITRTVDELIDSWIDRDNIDFVADFAAPLPQIVMTRVLGFPLKDMPLLKTWGEEQVRRYVYGRGHRNLLTRAEERKQAEVLAAFSAYVSKQITEKRRNPADDMISWLTQVTYEPFDRTLTDLEIQGIVYAMHLGGLETTQYAIAEQAQLFCARPDLFAQLKKDRTKLRVFIEEALRLRAPTQGLSTRMTSQDEAFQGVTVPAGSVLHMRFAAANLDEDQFDDAKTLNLDRRTPTRHLTFSHGPRSCPGSGISRLEQTIAWNRLLDRLDGISMAPETDVPYQPGIMLGALSMPVAIQKSP